MPHRANQKGHVCEVRSKFVFRYISSLRFIMQNVRLHQTMQKDWGLTKKAYTENHAIYLDDHKTMQNERGHTHFVNDLSVNHKF